MVYFFPPQSQIAVLLGLAEELWTEDNLLSLILCVELQNPARRVIVIASEVLQTPTDCDFPCFVLRQGSPLFLVHLTLCCSS